MVILENNTAFLKNKKSTSGEQKGNSRKQKGSSGKGYTDARIRAFTTSATSPPHSEVVIFGCFRPK